jgi:glycosyltransferase involved in cell wall biosynthesis
MESPVKILVVSSVTPKPTGFGEVTLHRHLVGDPRLKVEVVPHPGSPRLVRLLRRTAFRTWLEALEVQRQGYRWDDRARAAAKVFKPQVILTIAAGDGCHAALRVARELGVPLVSIFHDWWPDIVPAQVRTGEDGRFLGLYRGSRIALCVSEGMRRTLGEHLDARILWPISGKADIPEPTDVSAQDRNRRTFKICYSGNLREYAPMLQKALLAMKAHPSVRLEVRGMAPRWPKAFREEMLAAGMYHDFAPRDELERWLRSADAFLVTTAFEPAMRRMMETNFPSKLLEFARFSKPLVAWGPAYSSLIGWAQPANRACCVTDPNPNALRLALEQLAASPADQERLAAQAQNAMSQEFDPATIQEQFVQAVRDAAYAGRPEVQPQPARRTSLKLT